jgi:hypothetical protein
MESKEEKFISSLFALYSRPTKAFERRNKIKPGSEF